MASGLHQLWATISGNNLDEISADVDSLVLAGVRAIEYRFDLIPESLWERVLADPKPAIPWWIAHFGIAEEADLAKEALMATVRSAAAGVICHSRCAHLDAIAAAARTAGKGFVAPYHSQEPLTLQGALDEFAYQESLAPDFRKIAVRANSFADALALVEATHRASKDGGRPAVGAVFGTQRWARVALPSAGSAITFIVARKVRNEVGGDDEQLQLAEWEALSAIRGLINLQSVAGSGVTVDDRPSAAAPSRETVPAYDA